MVKHAYTQLPTGDVQALARLQKWGGEALVREVTAIFLTDAPKRLLAARQAASVADCVETGRAAHSLKSSSAHVGAPRMCQISEEIELLAHRCAGDRVPASWRGWTARQRRSLVQTVRGPAGDKA